MLLCSINALAINFFPCPQLPSTKNLILTEIDTYAEELEKTEIKPLYFQADFEGLMEMYGDAATVVDYLEAHKDWFARCARPMQVQPLGENGYILSVGRFGSFGYEVEPKIAVTLKFSHNGIYQMESIPVPNYTPSGYEVDYRAEMELVEVPAFEGASGIEVAFQKQKMPLPSAITKVNWQLHLTVKVRFPDFIYKLPLCAIQSTGDRVLTQIVKQISPRLTYKVQKDFHSRLHLPVPPAGGRQMRKISNSSKQE